MKSTLQLELSRLEHAYRLGARKAQSEGTYPFVSEAAVHWFLFLALGALPLALISVLVGGLHIDFSFFVFLAPFVGLLTWMVCSVVINFNRQWATAAYEQGKTEIICKRSRIVSGFLVHWDETTISLLTYHHGQLVTTEMIPWEEIASIWCLAHRDEERSHFAEYSYRIQRRDGAWLKMKRWSAYMALFEQKTLPLLLAQMLAAYERGEMVAFGPLSLSQSGLHHKERLLPWQDCEGIVFNTALGVVTIHGAQDQMGRLASKAWARLSERVEISQQDQQRFFQRKPWARLACGALPNLKVLDALLQHIRGTGLTEQTF